MSVIAFSRAIGPMPIDCILSEDHTSEIEITANPIETGAEVNDHAYIKPKQVVLEIADSKAALTYNALVRFQESRVPFYMVTGLSVYDDMLIASIDATRDKTNSTILRATVVCRQVLIVSTGSTTDGNEAQSKGKPGGKKSTTSSKPTAKSATNSATADKAASTVQTGDNPTTTVAPAKTQSIMKRMF